MPVGAPFRVDMSTLARRLSELGHIGQGEAHQIRATRTTRADIVQLDLLVHDELAPPSLARQYEESVLRLHHSETVSSARAIDLLFDVWGEEDLPQLPQLPENRIWDFVSY
jgi:hypothetical protein